MVSRLYGCTDSAIPIRRMRSLCSGKQSQNKEPTKFRLIAKLSWAPPVEPLTRISPGTQLQSLTADASLWQHWLGHGHAANSAKTNHASEGGTHPGAPCVPGPTRQRLLRPLGYGRAPLRRGFPDALQGARVESRGRCAVKPLKLLKRSALEPGVSGQRTKQLASQRRSAARRSANLWHRGRNVTRPRAQRGLRRLRARYRPCGVRVRFVGLVGLLVGPLGFEPRTNGL